MPMQSDEAVLVVPTPKFHELGRFQGLSSDFARYEPLFAPNAAHFMPRARAEEDPSFKQLIPYVVLRCGDRIFHYRRGSKGTEQRLHALRSIGVGGHINPVDGAGFDGVYSAAMMRELNEEVALPPGPPRLTPLGLINDDTTPVGQVHLGVVHLWDLDVPEVTPREAALAGAGFATVGELWSDRQSFETWSQFVLERLMRDSATIEYPKFAG
jgi:predicted NUDIX family phosphoesterase